MNTSWLPAHSVGRSAAVGTMLLLSACGGVSPADPQTPTTGRARLTATSDRTQGGRDADIGTCYKLRAPEGSTLAFHAYARGSQIYRWSGSAWTFVAPDAELFADAGGRGKIGTHYAGPTWESVSGSTVVGAVQERCTPNPSAIPWLLLGAQTAKGPGIFHGVIAIQRLNTVGGNAPTSPGTVIGEIEKVPYSAEYFFYRE